MISSTLSYSTGPGAYLRGPDGGAVDIVRLDGVGPRVTTLVCCDLLAISRHDGIRFLSGKYPKQQKQQQQQQQQTTSTIQQQQ